mgnify:CR=1 FL=1
MSDWIALTGDDGVPLTIRTTAVVMLRPVGLLPSGSADLGITSACDIYVAGIGYRRVRETYEQVRALLGIER